MLWCQRMYFIQCLTRITFLVSKNINEYWRMSWALILWPELTLFVLSNVRLHSLNSPYGRTTTYSSLRERQRACACVCVRICVRERVCEWGSKLVFCVSYINGNCSCVDDSAFRGWKTLSKYMKLILWGRLSLFDWKLLV